MKFFRIILLLTFLLVSITPPNLFASQIPAYLCELGLKFYKEGRYEDALDQFKKALLAEPGYEPALKYIQMIEKGGMSEQEEASGAVVPTSFQPASQTSAGAIQEMLDLIEIQKEMITGRVSKPLVSAREEKKQVPLANIILLDESLAGIMQPVNIEQDRSIILRGRNIKRFLLTQPDILLAEKKGPDELAVTAKKIGYTTLHVWDDNGRWTTEFLGVYPEPTGPTSEELIRREEDRAHNFKLRYSLDWYSYETGKGFGDLRRSFYSWSHSLGLNGNIPYGNVDASGSVGVVPGRPGLKTNLGSFTMGLTNGQLGPFKGFSLRGFNLNPPISNLTFSGATLRGGMLYSPAFNNKLNYSAFWAREGGGSYGNLSPDLAKPRKSYLDGFNINFSPTNKQNYKFSLLHGWGSDRSVDLLPNAYDLYSSWNLGQYKVDYEIAHDTKHLAQIFNMDYIRPGFNVSAEFRDIEKKFLSIMGSSARQGQLGGLFNLDFNLGEKTNVKTRLDMYRDRLYPAEEKPDRWNQDVNFQLKHQFDPTAALNLSYSFNNDLGRVSQYRYLYSGFGLNKSFKFIRDISAYMNYSHQESTNYNSHASDYINEKAVWGARINLINTLDYYITREMNWLNEKYYVDRVMPSATEMGLNWSGPIGNASSPLSGDFRFTYRDEEHTVSDISFLSGEDYIEGYTGLSFRPNDKTQFYGSCSVRNVWADNPNVTKRLDVNFNAGMRYIWDTGIRWEPVCNVEGYVFKDYNSDGLRQRDDPPVEGVKVWLGKKRSQVTDIFGYYRFQGVRALKAYVQLDTSTLPPGYMPTVPVTQDISVINHKNARVDFGITSRSEITGYVFEDVDASNEYNKVDKGVKGVILVLDDGRKTITDGSGRYAFTNASAGEHTVAMDLNSLPVYYLPKAAITKKLTLFEGMSYIYNIPLKRIKE